MYEQLGLENQNCFRFYTISRLIIRQYQPILLKHGLTYPQYLVLMVLLEKDRQPVNDIAKRLYLETNTVTPLLKRMEALKIVTRRKDKNDGRVVVVSLTEKGKYLQELLKDTPAQMACSVDVQKLIGNDMARLQNDLDTLIMAYDEALKTQK